MDQPAFVKGKVVELGVKYARQRTIAVFNMIIDDGTGRLHCRYWNQPFLERQFHVNEELMVYGRTVHLKPRTMDSPEVERMEGLENQAQVNRVVPVYPLTEGLPQRWLRSFIWRLLSETPPVFEEPWPPSLTPDFPTRNEAIRLLHLPLEMNDPERGRQRLALEEFVALQKGIQERRRRLTANAKGMPCQGDNRLMKPWLAQLGFSLTDAQKRVLKELRADLSRPLPMRRLLQGDVGSGKTVVAAGCSLMVMECGYNAALMAPTQILAEQHYKTFNRWFSPLGITVRLLTGDHDFEDAASSALANLSDASLPNTNRPLAMVVGTHALIEESVAIDNLGLVIIDEQHKFGVSQREKLLRKGHYPHLLAMTATPIPRTLGLALYGELDFSILDQSPPGRGRIRTFIRSSERMPKVLDFIKQKLGEGRQAYVVYPLIEESDKVDLKAVTQAYESLGKDLAPYEVGLLHGRLKAEEKEQIMQGFREQKIKILLSTSVIEVGVDVPNATMLLVENAEQFGLAQLHQMRGRIGRGAHESFCILMTNKKNPETQQRLEILEQTTDGFLIAERDLQLRGAGDFLGQAQSGLPTFQFADLARDAVLLDKARILVNSQMQ
jgi:ATP-dependent DNA helicase RecG